MMLTLQQEVDRLKPVEVPKLRTTREDLGLSRRDLAVKLNLRGGCPLADAVRTDQIAYWERSGRVPREYLDDLRAVVAGELAERRRRIGKAGL